MKLIQTLGTVLTGSSIIAVFALPIKAETYSCFNDLANRRGNYEYGKCIPHRLSYNRNGTAAYDYYMNLGARLAADEADYDSAMINFRRAFDYAKSEWQRKEATRGVIAAKAAKNISQMGGNAYATWSELSGVRSRYD